MELKEALYELLEVYKSKDYLSYKDLVYVANKYNIPMELLMKCIRMEIIKSDE